MADSYANKETKAFYEKLITKMETFPAAFCYGEKTYRGFPLPDFRETDRVAEKTGNRRADTITLSGPQGLAVVVQCAYWEEYRVSEWTIRFENRGQQNSAILSDVFCCALSLEGENPLLRGILGDHENNYKPYVIDLGKEDAAFESLSGRPTHVCFPYFNLEYGAGGAMFAFGWAGSWSARFHAEGEITTLEARSTVGMELYLKPGESVRTALTVMAPYFVRDEQYATNFWRKWFIRCNMPKADVKGNPLEPFSTCCLASDTGLPNSDGSISERSFTWRPSLEKMFAENVKTDFRWLDAGWYTDAEGNTVESDWWGTVGSWEVDPVKWPSGTLRESVDYSHAHGMKTLMWFEPERVTNPEALHKNYGYSTQWAIRLPGENAITNNIGDPDCLEWTTERLRKVLRENHIDMYREDNNSNPGMLWRVLDQKDGRRGITECRAVEAHYKMWDDLIETTKSNGGCAFCDSCASGGGRNDIESLRRGIPLLRSDSDRTTTALRLSMTTAFNRWIPFCGANTKEKRGQLDLTGRSDPYTWRASYLPVLNIDTQLVQDPDQNFDILRFGLQEWKSIRQFLLGDFYVLTPWHSEMDKTGFTAYSFLDPEKKEGFVLIFRMEECEESLFPLHLPYAGNEGWSLTDADTKESEPYREGMLLSLAEKRSARLLYIKECGATVC